MQFKAKYLPPHQGRPRSFFLTSVSLLLLTLMAPLLALPGDHLKPGQSLPAVTEPSQSGQLSDLRALAGPEGTVLVVYRSADW